MTTSPDPVGTATPEPSAPPTGDAPGASNPFGPLAPPPALSGGDSPAPVVAADRTAPRVRLAGGPRLTLSERATVTTTLKRGKRVIERTFTLAAGRHTLTPRRLAGRAKLQRGRYTLTVRVRDAAGNAAPARVLRFTV